MSSNHLVEDSSCNISEQFKYNLNKMIPYRNSLISKVEAYNNIKKSLDGTKWPTLVSLGDGYFVEMGPNDAKEFLDRRLNEIQQEIDTINFQTDGEMLTQNTKNISPSENSNEESKYVEIREELDEDGSVISVNLNNEKFDLIDGNNAKSGVNRTPNTLTEAPVVESISNSGTNVLVTDNWKALKDRISDKSVASNQNDDTASEIKEMLHDLGIFEDRTPSAKSSMIDTLLAKIDELNINSEDKFKLKSACLDATLDVKEANNVESAQFDKRITEGEKVLSKEHQTMSSSSGTGGLEIPSDEILQLELIENEDSDQLKFSDNEEWDYDFDNEDIEGIDGKFDSSSNDHSIIGYSDDGGDDDYDDDNDKADDILYGAEPVGFYNYKNDASSSSKINQLLWNQVNNIRSQNRQERLDQPNIKHVENSETQTSIPNKNKGKKSVRFSNNLHIKEIDNVSEQLKNIEHRSQRMSKFKQARVVNNLSSREPSFEGDANSADSALSYTVVEKEFPNTSETALNENESIISKKKSSRFSKSRRPVIDQTPTELDDNHDTITLNPGNFSNSEEKKLFVSGESEHNKEISSVNDGINEIKDFHAIHDLDTMAKLYMKGFYDEDIVTRGPLVDKLDDFEMLNKLVNSMSKDNEAVSLAEDKDETENDFKVDELEKEDDFSDDEPVLSEEVIENDFVISEDNGDESDQEILSSEYEMLQSEINQDYQKLKQKLLYEERDETSEQEMEPLDESGNPVKVSRFKSRRSGNNGLAF